MSVQFTIALIPGDGIGQEVIPAARQVLEALHLPVTFLELHAGWETFQQTGTALPQETLTALRQCDGALFGAVSSPSQRVEGYSSPILAMRKHFDLYANLRPVTSAPIPSSRPNIDMLIVRENTECLYVKRERLEDNGNTAIADRVITRKASQRIVCKAFEMAVQRQGDKETRRRGDSPPYRSLVTIVHKANVLSLTDGLFRESGLTVAKEYPQIAVEDQIVDSMIYKMILQPEAYDVIVAPNLYGDILSDAAAALVGGLGLAPSANVGDHFVLCEPVHGSAPDIAGKGIANPVAAIRAAGLLLNALGEGESAQRIERSVIATLRDQVWTRDLGGSATTQEMTKSILERLA